MNETNTLPERERSLYQFWERTKNTTAQATPVSAEEWNAQVYYLSQAGVGFEEALNYLYNEQPSFEDFVNWLPGTHSTGKTDAEDTFVLTAGDHEFWERNGYIVIRNAVSQQQCAAARTAIWEFLNADPEQPETWYAPNDDKKGLMLNFFQHPALAANRNSARIKSVFEQLYNSTDIYLLVDKVSYNPPETSAYHFQGSRLHWDVSLHLPIPYVLQGLLYLNDVNATDGAFHCVPGFHKKIDGWMAALPEDADPRAAALAELQPEAVPGKAGDMIIWHQALPHCATPNRGSTPRMVQYITYKPMKVAEASVWK